MKTSVPTKIVSIFVYCTLLLCGGVTGCRTVSVYEGARLTRESVGVLDLRPGFSTVMDAHFHMMAIDGRGDPTWGSNSRHWSPHTDPRYFELLPGRRVLSLDYVEHHRAGEQWQTGNVITTFLRDEISSRGVRTVILNVEANHKYAAKRAYGRSKNYGQGGNWQISIIDNTTGRAVAQSSHDVDDEDLDKE